MAPAAGAAEGGHLIVGISREPEAGCASLCSGAGSAVSLLLPERRRRVFASPGAQARARLAGRFQAPELLASRSVCTERLALVFSDNGVWFLRIQSRCIFLSACHMEPHLAICHLFQLNSLSLGGQGMSGSSSDDYRQKPCVFSSLKLCSIV